MHPWAAYLITQDNLEREERHRRARAARDSVDRDGAATRRRPVRAGAKLRPSRAMGCAV
ncbi:hypothetical protein [Mumia sp. DW29H23]|uniref:hypothetical protein n=1 Tax=Mumia sp. DW29H23 TaxID=3421241 RepID=UPI003D68DD9B